ncbi:Rieske 2Fe-2S domain-containing protein [Rhizorhabdus dicambivorans]|uniref:Rieske domain-containing protein n=1 Tax=Rhizorhabdus dicambivorans TaxID=1850238 RepID=A0A2A4G2H4_9SPHN|nr:Rieske 2Fe-2S domain-containing protein [Rhizorhabdus dicambivorans]ATE66531.1 hypothetical protein CMV14_20695 [Rhizorhabdus dicambivorans]PCE43987.1 hypothetical protein COO09_03455 [Rhizorhabdus dicambivorans]
MDVTRSATPEARRRAMVADLGPGAHQCWYPIALSRDVPKGKAIGADLADGRVVIYRGEDEVVRVMSAFCKHMGADLSVGGDVVGNNIRCPYHHWEFGQGGKCKVIASGDPIPKGSSLANLPTAERLGLIWVFLGETPLYDLPTFEEFDDTKHAFRAFEIDLEAKLNVEPWIFATNVFDVVHNRVVHGLQFADPDVEEVSPYLRRMSWDAAHTGEKQEGVWRPDIAVHGVNGITTRSEVDGRLKWYVAVMTPCGSLGTKVFFSIVTTKDDKSEEYFDTWQAMHNRFVNEDLPILNGLRIGDMHLVGADRAMARFMRAVRKYPRTTLDALETAANAAERKAVNA